MGSHNGFLVPRTKDYRSLFTISSMINVERWIFVQCSQIICDWILHRSAIVLTSPVLASQACAIFSTRTEI